MSSETRFPSDCSLDVVGIGNAIVDVLVQTDDGFIAEHGLQKGEAVFSDETVVRLHQNVNLSLIHI